MEWWDNPDPLPSTNCDVLVTGDRRWTDIDSIRTVLSTFAPNRRLIHGYADGADILADTVGRELGFVIAPEPAHWTHSAPRWVEIYGYCRDGCAEVCGRPAGVLRNQKMLIKYPTIGYVLAFHTDIQASRGTKDMIRRAWARGIPVWLYDGTTLHKNFVTFE